MSTTRQFKMPPRTTPLVDGNGILTGVWAEYLASLEDVTGRVASSIDAGTATTSDIVTALKTSKQMKSS